MDTKVRQSVFTGVHRAMIKDILDHGLRGQLGLVMAKDQTGKEIPYLVLVNQLDGLRTEVIPMGPLLGEYSHGFEPIVASGHLGEVLRIKPTLEDILKMDKDDDEGKSKELPN